MAKYSFQIFFVSRIGAALFLAGKVIRFLFFFGFLLMIFSGTKALSGYNFFEVGLFYMTFNFIDSTTQMLFREVYRFRYYIVSGNFDMLLLKPINVLFRSLFLVEYLYYIPCIAEKRLPLSLEAVQVFSPFLLRWGWDSSLLRLHYYRSLWCFWAALPIQWLLHCSLFCSYQASEAFSPVICLNIPLDFSAS